MNSCAELLVAGLLEKANSRAVIDPRVTYIISCRHFGCYTMDVIAILFPRIMIPSTNLFKYSAYYPQDSLDFFCDVSAKIIEQRKQDSDASRVDLLQLMLNAELQDDENESKATKRLSVEELNGQMSIVIVAGYETTASLLQYVAYDVSELMYDVIQDMPYLDQVINETLRMYPPLA
ncbi:CP3AT-like protein, partial [Mya arenaria]